MDISTVFFVYTIACIVLGCLIEKTYGMRGPTGPVGPAGESGAAGPPGQCKCDG